MFFEQKKKKSHKHKVDAFFTIAFTSGLVNIELKFS